MTEAIEFQELATPNSQDQRSCKEKEMAMARCIELRAQRAGQCRFETRAVVGLMTTSAAQRVFNSCKIRNV